MYCPPVNIRVLDHRAFGRKPLVGLHCIETLDKYRVSDQILAEFRPAPKPPKEGAYKATKTARLMMQNFLCCRDGQEGRSRWRTGSCCHCCWCCCRCCCRCRCCDRCFYSQWNCDCDGNCDGQTADACREGKRSGSGCYR